MGVGDDRMDFLQALVECLRTRQPLAVRITVCIRRHPDQLSWRRR